MRKLKSSIRSLQESLTRLKQAGPFCVHEARTHSFGAGEVLCSSFGHLQLSPSSSSPLQPEPAVRMKHLPPSSSSSKSSSSSSSSSTQPTEGGISSTRFFFSPSNTNSIMEAQAKQTRSTALAPGSFYEGSEAAEISSVDPYRDFKLSMAEMVRAHEIREWLNLQELLHCFLRLNDGKNHEFIVLAFVDLVAQLVAEDRETFAFSAADPLCLCVCDLIK